MKEKKYFGEKAFPLTKHAHTFLKLYTQHYTLLHKPLQIMQSALRSTRTMVACPAAWLPESTAYLAVALEPEAENRTSSILRSSRPGHSHGTAKSEHRVWFPEDANGEPHPKNPDDGCGGAKYRLFRYCVFYHSLRHTRIAENAAETREIYRRACLVARDARTEWEKNQIWQQFITDFDKISHPTYSYSGLLWRQLFGSAPRTEEEEAELKKESFDTLDSVFSDKDEDEDYWEKLKEQICASNTVQTKDGETWSLPGIPGTLF